MATYVAHFVRQLLQLVGSLSLELGSEHFVEQNRVVGRPGRTLKRLVRREEEIPRLGQRNAAVHDGAAPDVA